MKAKAKKRGKTGNIPSSVLIHRTGRDGEAAFEACVRISRRDIRGAAGSECAYGSNPRKAVARALIRLGGALKRRPGAFKGKK